MVDLPPEALLERLRTGKIYPPERIEPALEQLLQDREPGGAARGGAAPGGRGGRGEAHGGRAARRHARGPTSPSDAPQAVGERLLALVEPYPGSQRLVRRAWRSAQRLGADLDLLWIRPPGRELDAERETALSAVRQLASVLGTELLVVEHDDVVEARCAGR